MTLSSFFLFLLLPLLLQLDKFLLHVPQVVRCHLSPLQQPLCLLLPSLLLLLLLLCNESRRAGNHRLDPVVGCQPHAAPPAPSLASLLAASLPLLLLLLLWLLLLFLLLASELCGKVAGGDVLVHAGAEVALSGLLPVCHHPLLHLSLVVDAVSRHNHLLWLRSCLLFPQLDHSSSKLPSLLFPLLLDQPQALLLTATLFVASLLLAAALAPCSLSGPVSPLSSDAGESDQANPPAPHQCSKETEMAGSCQILISSCPRNITNLKCLSYDVGK